MSMEQISAYRDVRRRLMNPFEALQREIDIAKAELVETQEQLALARNELRDLKHGIFPDRSLGKIRMRAIVNAVSNRFGIPVATLLSVTRTKRIVYARHIAFYCINELTGMTLAEIGRRIAYDHTTIMSAVRKLHVRVEAGELPLLDHINAIRALIQPGPLLRSTGSLDHA